MHLEVRVPKNPRDSKGTASFIAFDDKVFRFAVRASYAMSGVVGFKDSVLAIRVPIGSGNQRVFIPIFVGEKSSEELIELESSESLKGIEFSLEVSKKGVMANVRESAVKDGRIVGNLIIKNIESGCTNRLILDVDTEHAIMVYPSVVQFYRTSESDGKLLSARILVKDANANKSSANAVAGTFRFFNTQLDAKVISARGAVTYYQISLPADILPETRVPMQIDCDLVGSNSRRTISVPVRLVPTSTFPSDLE
jgi:hypothetical protein